ncbi:hypothetical protein [Segniliparus rugosus]|uniref:Uncharacterized protein n=1 Tax=Segniliparus rugosus (strain ATCC BAA-974 / DSM 45345 / CCUG 50838 / CIP 108380 / JCM 13579 / CDC 945) TaxID=679197 RepID=E5XP09_SEGRC|nr:hypothetical protein [Segniliparus rugosus]EFV13901.1 hypothetical protein HMPREF9336_01230 [Segniliparus rugosus ATCC BAA-974]
MAETSPAGEGDVRERTARALGELIEALRRYQEMWAPGAEHPSVLNEPIRSVVGQTWKDGLTLELDQQLTRAHEYPQAALRELICLVDWLVGACEIALAAVRRAEGEEEIAVALRRSLGDGDKAAASALQRRRKRVLAATQAVRSSLGAFVQDEPDESGEAAQLSEADVEMCHFVAGVWSTIVVAGDEYLQLHGLLDLAVRDARSGVWPTRDIAPSLERLRDMMTARIKVVLEECRFNARVLRGMGDREAPQAERQRSYQELWDRNRSRVDYILI